MQCDLRWLNDMRTEAPMTWTVTLPLNLIHPLLWEL